MKPAEAYLALYDAFPALRGWLPTHRPAFDAAVHRAVAEAQRPRYAPRKRKELSHD